MSLKDLKKKLENEKMFKGGALKDQSSINFYRGWDSAIEMLSKELEKLEGKKK